MSDSIEEDIPEQMETSRSDAEKRRIQEKHRSPKLTTNPIKVSQSIKMSLDKSDPAIAQLFNQNSLAKHITEAE